ncbi:MAG: hypothetical protein LBP83_01415 [Dysgonamonadaceae bacterium]|jgi:hypothetical protein|nr:hypothetical protein [Dysgonamonadaceae bacterium]
MHNLLINYKIKKAVEKREAHKKNFLTLRKIRNIIVFLDTEDYEEADVFIDHLERMGKKVTSYAYKSKKDIYDYSETPYIIIDYKDTSKWFENKLEKIANEIKQVHYDALFDLTIERNPTLEFLVACANATFKVGHKKRNNIRLYDFTISALKVNNNNENLRTREFGKQILHYLSTIKTN